MKELVLIKLGGSVITDKSKEFTARPENIKRLAGEIKSALKVFKGAIVIGHGAGSFAHLPAKKYQTKKGFINSKSLMGMSIVEDAARQLNAIVIKEFIKENLPVFPFSPASFILNDPDSGVKSYIDPIRHALMTGSHPVIYGDVIMDKTTGCTIFSTEKVLSIIAKELLKDYKIRMIYVTDVNGVHDEKGMTIPVITSKNFDQLKSSIVGAKNVDVTGGMLHKVEQALSLAKKYDILTLIVNGNEKNNLKNAVMDKKTTGTRIC